MCVCACMHVYVCVCQRECIHVIFSPVGVLHCMKEHEGEKKSDILEKKSFHSLRKKF